MWLGAGDVGQHAITVGQWTAVGEQHSTSGETDKGWNAYGGWGNTLDTDGDWAKGWSHDDYWGQRCTT